VINFVKPSIQKRAITDFQWGKEEWHFVTLKVKLFHSLLYFHLDFSELKVSRIFQAPKTVLIPKALANIVFL